jgi:hypothetical protein
VLLAGLAILACYRHLPAFRPPDRIRARSDFDGGADGEQMLLNGSETKTDEIIVTKVREHLSRDNSWLRYVISTHHRIESAAAQDGINYVPQELIRVVPVRTSDIPNP